MSGVEEILNYWLGPAGISPDAWQKQTKRWYASDPEIDQEINGRFGPTLAAAEAGDLDDWQRSTSGCLALIILFDQFSRNLYRGHAKAFCNDPRAVTVTDHLVLSGKLHELDVPAQLLAFHPYHHAEDLSRQEQVVELARHLLKTSGVGWHKTINNNLDYLENHANVIRLFGRFPHRNDILGRQSTLEELEHMRQDPRTFGQHL